MSVYKKDNKFGSLLLILFSLFILVFFTKDTFYDLQSNMDYESELSTKSNTLSGELVKVTALKKELNEEGDKKEIVSKFDTSISEDQFIEYIYDYVEDINSDSGIITISGIEIQEPVESELGFLETKLNVSAKFSNEDIMKTFLDFLVSKESKYTFYVNEFSFKGYDKITNVPLRLFHK